MKIDIFCLRSSLTVFKSVTFRSGGLKPKSVRNARVFRSRIVGTGFSYLRSFCLSRNKKIFGRYEVDENRIFHGDSFLLHVQFFLVFFFVLSLHSGLYGWELGLSLRVYKENFLKIPTGALDVLCTGLSHFLFYFVVSFTQTGKIHKAPDSHALTVF